MTWRPQKRPELIADGYKEPGQAYSLNVTNTSASVAIAEDYKCISMFFPADAPCYWDINNTASDADHYANGAERIDIALPTAAAGNTTTVHIRTAPANASGKVYITAYKRDT